MTEFERFKEWRRNYGYGHQFPADPEQLMWLAWEARHLEDRKRNDLPANPTRNEVNK